MSVCDTPKSHTYRVHGTTLSTLEALPCALTTSPAAWRHLGAKNVLPTPADAEQLACLRLGNAGYLAQRAGVQVWLEFLGQVTFLVDLRQREITHRLHAGGDPRLLEQFLANAVMALCLGLEGIPLLHASAVRLNEFALGIAGPSGSGKSSLAAALCAQRAVLMTDDTLCVGTADTELTCLPGTARLRLREPSQGLAAELDGSTSLTSDARLGITFPTFPQDETTPVLRCLWLPEIVEPTVALQAIQLSGQERLLSLISNVRIAGWSARVMAGLLPQIRHISSRLLVYRLRLPAGSIYTEHGRQQVFDLMNECFDPRENE